MGKIYVVILAGGAGERLWPLSSHSKPKQLLPFFHGTTLLEQAVERAVELVPLEQRWIVTTQEYEEAIENVVGPQIGQIIVEPSAQNTAAAMMLAARTIEQEDPEATVAFLAADHYIPDGKLFSEFMHHALDYAQEHASIVLLGLKPTYPATGYGYLQFEHFEPFPASIKAFHEKPNKETAQEYLEKGYLWNSGIFVAQVKAFLSECQTYAFDTLHKVDQSLAGEPFYDRIEPVSIDYAVMEKSKNLVVLPVDFVWSDVGNLETFLSLKQRDAKYQEIIEIDAQNHLIESKKKIVALVGVNDLCVIETGDVLLIADRYQSEKVKLVLQKLKQKQQDAV